eukprot:1152842-Pelagomonas_calceolata.AAC.9
MVKRCASFQNACKQHLPTPGCTTGLPQSPDTTALRAPAPWSDSSQTARPLPACQSLIAADPGDQAAEAKNQSCT